MRLLFRLKLKILILGALIPLYWGVGAGCTNGGSPVGLAPAGPPPPENLLNTPNNNGLPGGGNIGGGGGAAQPGWQVTEGHAWPFGFPIHLQGTLCYKTEESSDCKTAFNNPPVVTPWERHDTVTQGMWMISENKSYDFDVDKGEFQYNYPLSAIPKPPETLSLKLSFLYYSDKVGCFSGETTELNLVKESAGGGGTYYTLSGPLELVKSDASKCGHFAFPDNFLPQAGSVEK